MILFYIILTLLAFILHSPLIHIFTIIGNIRPDFILIIMIWIVFREQKAYVGEMFAFLIGFVEDCLSGGLFGLNAFTKTILAYIMNQVKGNIGLESYPPMAAFILIVSLSEAIIFLLFQSIFAGNVQFFKAFLHQGFFTGIFNGLIGPLVYLGLDRLVRSIPRLKK